MKERKRPELPSDPRLRDLLPALESLPEELRDALVSTLEAVVKAHRLLESDPGSRSGDAAPPSSAVG